MNSKLPILLILILICFTSCSQKKSKNNILKLKDIYEITKNNFEESLSTYLLKGNIKSIEGNLYTISKDSIIDFSNYKMSDFSYPNLSAYSKSFKANFNKNGKLINRIEYLLMGDITKDTLYYDKNDNITLHKSKTESENDFSDSNIIYEYNEKGHIIKKSVDDIFSTKYSYYPEKKQVKSVNLHYDINESLIRTYNEFGLLLEIEKYNSTGVKIDRRIFSYNDYGEVETLTLFDIKKNTSENIEYESDYENDSNIYCKYDKIGNCIERITFNPGGKKTLRKFKYEYYE
ncbi:hypothetical protein LNJ03_12070 [Tenacibaculum dicentrarchi]|nr:hypothetical protein [Tenacibaculum dicentrarchi]